MDSSAIHRLSKRAISAYTRMISSWDGRWCLLVCVQKRGAEIVNLHPLEHLRRSHGCRSGSDAAAAFRLLGNLRGGRWGMVEARSGFFRAGLDAVFTVLETGRGMLNSLSRGGALQRYPAPK